MESNGSARVLEAISQLKMTESEADDTASPPALAITADLAARIFIEISPTDLAAASLTCTTWNRWAAQDQLWEAHIHNEYSSASKDDTTLTDLLKTKSWYRLFLARKQLDHTALANIRQLQWPSSQGTDAFNTLLNLGYPNIVDGLRRIINTKAATTLGDRYWTTAALHRLKARHCATELRQIILNESPAEEAALVISTALQLPSKDPSWARNVLDMLGAEAKRRIDEVRAQGLTALNIVHTVLFGPNWLGVNFDYHETGYVVSPQQGFGIHLQGARDDYYNPLNSFIDRVLQRRMGIPITLSIIHAAVCTRAGLPVRLLNIPGHLISHFGEPGTQEERFIDCFDQGRMFTREAARDYFEARVGVDITHPTFLTPMSTRGIALRMLHNLLAIYSQSLLRVDDSSMRIVARLMLSITDPNRLEESNGDVEAVDLLPMYDQDGVSLITRASSNFQFQPESAAYKARLGVVVNDFAFGRDYRMSPFPPPPPTASPHKYSIGQIISYSILHRNFPPSHCTGIIIAAYKPYRMLTYIANNGSNETDPWPQEFGPYQFHDWRLPCLLPRLAAKICGHKGDSKLLLDASENRWTTVDNNNSKNKHSVTNTSAASGDDGGDGSKEIVDETSSSTTTTDTINEADTMNDTTTTNTTKEESIKVYEGMYVVLQSTTTAPGGAAEILLFENGIDEVVKDWNWQRDGDVHPDVGKYFTAYDEEKKCYVPNEYIKFLTENQSSAAV